MNYLSMFLIFIIYFINKCYCESKRFITIPFTIQQENSYPQNEYNPDIFIYNNFYKNYTFDFLIGNPPQKVDGIIINDNFCFEMKLAEDIGNNMDYIKASNNKYSPKESSSFSLYHKELRWTKGQYQTLAYDLFNFESNKSKNYNLSLLVKESSQSTINIDEIKNKKYIIKFGLNVQNSFSGDECPNFMIYIRSKASTAKYISSFIFKNSNKGDLVIGDELYKYNPKIYNESYHIGVYTFKYNALNYDNEIIYDALNKTTILNKSEAFINYNYGIVIGTDEYKQKIDEIFFNKLISNNICRIQITKLNESSYYYIYICKQNIDLNNFPKLVFFSRNYKFNFELNYQDLFVKKSDNNIYFLILFNINKESNKEWILGEPFYKKYIFSFNLDARIVGFYSKIFSDENQVEDDKVDNIDTQTKNKTSLLIVFIILGVIFVAILMILSFYFGMKLKEKRKLRANELKEDNYEYFPESEQEDNKIIN